MRFKAILLSIVKDLKNECNMDYCTMNVKIKRNHPKDREGVSLFCPRKPILLLVFIVLFIYWSFIAV